MGAQQRSRIKVACLRRNKVTPHHHTPTAHFRPVPSSRIRTCNSPPPYTPISPHVSTNSVVPIGTGESSPFPLYMMKHIHKFFGFGRQKHFFGSKLKKTKGFVICGAKKRGFIFPFLNPRPPPPKSEFQEGDQKLIQGCVCWT